MLTSRKSAHGFALSLCLLVTRTALCSGGDSCPSTIGTEHQGFVHRSQCYQFVNRKEWWGTARDFCARKGGHLIQLDNAELAAFIKDKLRGNFGDWDKVWIGANDRGTENKWIWDGSDEEISYSNWGQGQPATSIIVGPFEDCATMEKADDYRWHDHACGIVGQAYQFICQYDAVNRTTTTSTTTSSTITTETTTGTKTAKTTTTTIRDPSSTTVAPPAAGNRTAGNHSTPSALLSKTTTTTMTIPLLSSLTPVVLPSPGSKTAGHHPTTSFQSARDSCPSTIGTEHQGFVHRSQCYQFVNRKEWWGTARDFCARKEGHLIQLDNAELVAFIKGKLRGNFGDWDKVWIGANDIGTENKWIWDGSV
ncbi:uncharacterized protein LOC106162765 [Lingula anatina]|uniref:Uncharacterized protein LOC106162765 n=1 Tax=Lingula anatina TaxID=7574 RepID=A0A1S3IBK0_LINAN|nr:uncharacterized protein LOC106162765 [Lingula anatina]|eukprot:XP_013395635.1 uncharacterized protein LOC106162765 [Lingula anatina]